MRKVIAIILPFLFLGVSVFSQDSTLSNISAYKNSYAAAPLIVIKGDEIKRFPSNNFLDAVNAFFPWVFSETPATNNFLFVVNGYVLQDINALSLYDIDEIVFTRNNLNGSLYPFSRAGIFYIKTKTGSNKKPEISFNSQYNIVWNKNAQALNTSVTPAYPPLDLTNNKMGDVFSNQISLAVGGKKFHLYSSVQLDASQEPHLSQQHIRTFAGSNLDTAFADLKERQTNFRSFVSAEYDFTQNLSAGIIGNYFHGQTKQDYAENGTLLADELYAQTATSKLPLQNYHAGSFINWRPIRGLTNKFSFEYSNDDFNYKQTGEEKNYVADTLRYTIHTLTTVKPYGKTYLFRDQLSYEFLLNKKFKAGAGAVFSYVHNSFRSETGNFVTQGGLNNSASTSTMYSKGGTTTLDPGIHFSYNDFLSGYAGYNFYLNKGASKLSKNSRTNPYAGIVVDLKNALKLRSANRLDISFDYGDLPENALNNYWAPSSDPQQYYFSSQVYSTTQPFFIPNPSLQYLLLKNKLSGVQANAGFLDNRFLVGSKWTSLELQSLFLVVVPIGGNSSGVTAVLGKEKQTGLSIYTSGKLIDKADFRWTARLNLLFPHIKYEVNAITIPGYEPVNYTLQSGFQNKFQYKAFTIQLNLLYGLDRKYFETNNNTVQIEKKFNEFSLSYFIFGYDLANIKTQVFRNLGVFIQGRNLLSSKTAKEYYRYDSYGGAGINLKFK